MRLVGHGALTLPMSGIYKALGSGSTTSQQREGLEPLVETLRQKAVKRIRPRSLLRVVEVEVSGPEEVLLQGNVRLHCRNRFFQGATHAGVILATVGPGLEQLSRQYLHRGEYLEGLVLDACGTAALDEVFGKARQVLEEIAPAPGFKLGYTLSPGCQLISVEEQAVIFSLLDFEMIEIELNEAYMMHPVKSLSGIVPMGQHLALPNQSNYACEICDLQKTCAYRSNELCTGVHIEQKMTEDKEGK